MKEDDEPSSDSDTKNYKNVMSNVSTLRNKIRSKIEVIKKINDNPKLTSDNLYDLYGEGVTKVDKLLQNKIGGLTSKLSKKSNENKQDIFGALIDTPIGFPEFQIK